MLDILVVGSGPSGSTIAKKLSEYGYKVAIVEEHVSVGLPVQCTGLISPETISLSQYKGHILNTIYGANIFSPSLKKYEFSASISKAVVIDRRDFDRSLINEASKKGVEILLQHKFISYQIEENNIVSKIKTNEGLIEIKSKILVGADGFGSTVRKRAKIPGPKEMLSAYEMEVSTKELDSKKVEVYFGNIIAPSFFGWVVPAENFYRIGIAALTNNNNALHYFEKFKKAFMSVHNLQEKDIKDLSIITGGIPIGIMKSFTYKNIVLVGDAASTIKPISGGGIYYGILSSIVASKYISEAIDSNDLTKLKMYEKIWYSSYGKEIKKGYSLRKIFKSLNDKDIESLLKLLNDENLIKIVTDGNIDKPSELAKLLIKKFPTIAKMLLPKIKSIYLS
jgi:geranylgeranyl reductase family protein